MSFDIFLPGGKKLNADDRRTREDLILKAHKKRGPFIPTDQKKDKTMITREQLEKLYEDETGLKANRGPTRIDNLAQFVAGQGITDLAQLKITNEPRRLNRDYKQGIAWYQGTQHGPTMLLGYTSDTGPFLYKNAIFVTDLRTE